MLLYLGAEGFNQKNKYTLSYTTFYALQHLFYELFMIFPKKLSIKIRGDEREPADRQYSTTAGW